ncbi:MAG TPA: hypothetical protein VGI85_04460 [Chthoniobacterales bacterium]|jgi:hypothetical protein
MKKLLLAAALAGGLLGCASYPAGPGNSVPAARRFESELLQPSPERNCALTIMREVGGSGPAVDFYLDGDRVARVAAGEMITFFVRPGRHQLDLRPLSSPRVERLLTLQKGDEIAVRIIDRNGNYELRMAEPGWQKSIGSTFQSQVWDPLSRRVSASSRNPR